MWHQCRNDSTLPSSYEVCRMKRALLLPISLGVLLAACGDPPTSGTPAVNEGQLPAAAALSVDPVVQCNRTLLQIVRSAGAQPSPVHATHSFAVVDAAVYDAVTGIDGTPKPY